MSLRRHVYIDARRCSWALALAMTTLTAAPVAISCDSAKTRTPLTRAPTPPRTNNAIAPTGLQLVRWYVPLDPAIRRDGIARLIELKLATRVESPLASNGITLLRVKTVQLKDVVHELGSSLAARRTTLGQTNAFADLATVALSQGTAVMTGGRPELSDETRLRLAVRGWCFPTVEGACARIELLLGETALRLTSVSIDPSEVRERTRELIDGRMTLELASDESLIVLETPLVLAAADADDGPVALPPPSRASLLLRGAPFAERALVLVIEPSFADILPQASQRLPAPSP